MESITLPRLRELDLPLKDIEPISGPGSTLSPSASGLRPGKSNICSSHHPHLSYTKKHYDDEEVDFIRYFRVDCSLNWKEVLEEYNDGFCKDAKNGHKRNLVGLQSVYYRNNKEIPLIDPNGLLMFDEDHKPRTISWEVRKQRNASTVVGLLTIHPERAITYPWVSKEHKKQCEELGKKRQAQLSAMH
ncbi:hypothetical protein CI238_12773 [Colletotrichum incanum]|uniref:Uncharacterized protein n=1 Tax=Colletotrichum incanum TaxID=1573173 RepID=A0A167AEL1_COLIC|nr:hypothetical protein CI238_12773 [Colletotrichum incanum]